MKRERTSKFVAAIHNQVIMPPILFADSMFPKFLQLKGDKGAKTFLHGEFLNQGQLILYTGEGLFYDVETEDDYIKVTKSGMKNSK